MRLCQDCYDEGAVRSAEYICEVCGRAVCENHFHQITDHMDSSLWVCSDCKRNNRTEL